MEKHEAAEVSTKTDTRIPIHCVFEGGGAKGVAHIGVVGAIQEIEELKVTGYSGTSAGAIAASLAAAGWEFEELFSEPHDGKYKIKALETIGEHDVTALSDLLGKEWKKLQIARSAIRLARRSLSNWTHRLLLACAALLIFFWPFSYFLAILPFMTAASSSGTVAGTILLVAPMILSVVGWVVYLTSIVAASALLCTLYFFKGLADLRNMVKVLDKLLAYKVTPADGHRVRFRDLRENGCELKVVAANMRGGTLALFDADNEPDVAVSDAVAASACIPFIFKPVEIGGSQYCDGGIVSNLPAWSFDREALNNNWHCTVTSEVSELAAETDTGSAPTAEPLYGLRLLERVARTAAFGGAVLNTRGLDVRVRILPDATISVLDFDNTETQAFIVKETLKQSRALLYDFLDEVYTIDFLHEAVKTSLSKMGLPSDSLRTALVREVKVLDKPSGTFQIWLSRGYDGYPDQRLLLPGTRSLAGMSIAQRRTLYLDLKNPEHREAYKGIFEDGDIRGRLADDRDWIVSVPIETEGLDHLSCAVAFDGGVVSKPPAGYDVAQVASIIREVVSREGIFSPYLQCIKPGVERT